MAGNIRLYNTSGYVELQAPASASAQTLVLPTDSIQPGLVKIVEQSFSSASSVSVNNCFTATYQNYRIVFALIGSDGTSRDFTLRLRASGSDTSGSVYYTGGVVVTNTAGPNRVYDSGTAQFYCGGLGDYQSLRIFDIGQPFGSVNTSFQTHFDGAGTSSALYGTLAGFINNTTSYDGFSVFRSSGTMTGTLRIYGYRN